MINPTVSVLMPVFNAEKYLNESIDSILNQTFTDFEFIIINDGSTDKSEEIILSYNDSRIRYFKNEENLQIVKTLNKGIELACGKYIVRMDSDDISLPKRFEKQIEFMEKNTDVDISGTWMKEFGEGIKSSIRKTVTEHEEIKAQLLFNTPLSHPTLIIRKDSFIKNKLTYNHSYNHVEDYELWTRAVKCLKIANIPKVYLLYRIYRPENDVKAYGRERIDLDKKVQLNFLRELNYTLDEQEQKTYYNLSVFVHPITIDMLKKMNVMCQNIYIKNKKNLVFEEKSLVKVLNGIFYKKCYTASRGNGLLAFIEYQKFNKSLKNFSFNKTSILFIKSLFFLVIERNR